MKMFGELRLVRALTDEQIGGNARPAPRRHGEIADDRGCGKGGRLPRRPAGGHHRSVKAVEKRYPGLDRVICATPLDLQPADLDRFAKEVIPAFRDTRTAAAAE
jgi:hypothetical protein